MSAITLPKITKFDSKPTDVYFFGTCVLDLFMPEAGMDAITLIEQQAYGFITRWRKAAAANPPTLPVIRPRRLMSPKRNSTFSLKTGRSSYRPARAAA